MFFPVFIDLSKKNILVVGAGAIAWRRIRILRGFAGRITVVAPQIHEKIREMQAQPGICENEPGMEAAAEPEICEEAPEMENCPVYLCEREFRESDLDGCDIVLAATDDAVLNREIAALCKSRGIFVNVSSEQALCDFQFPSVVQDGGVVIGINASGKDHRLVKETRKKVERCMLEEGQRGLYDGQD